jgi:hypothetical protein
MILPPLVFPGGTNSGIMSGLHQPHLPWLFSTNRIFSISVISPKVTKASKGGIIGIKLLIVLCSNFAKANEH